jgi:hypothetical protein
MLQKLIMSKFFRKVRYVFDDILIMNLEDLRCEKTAESSEECAVMCCVL